MFTSFRRVGFFEPKARRLVFFLGKELVAMATPENGAEEAIFEALLPNGAVSKEGSVCCVVCSETQGSALQAPIFACRSYATESKGNGSKSVKTGVFLLFGGSLFIQMKIGVYGILVTACTQVWVECEGPICPWAQGLLSQKNALKAVET